MLIKQKIKKIASLVALILVIGLATSFLGKIFFESKLGQKVEKKLGLKTGEETAKNQTAQATTCVQQEEQDNSALFVGCNGFF